MLLCVCVCAFASLLPRTLMPSDFLSAPLIQLQLQKPDWKHPPYDTDEDEQAAYPNENIPPPPSRPLKRSASAQRLQGGSSKKHSSGPSTNGRTRAPSPCARMSARPSHADVHSGQKGLAASLRTPLSPQQGKNTAAGNHNQAKGTTRYTSVAALHHTQAGALPYACTAAATAAHHNHNHSHQQGRASSRGRGRGEREGSHLCDMALRRLTPDPIKEVRMCLFVCDVCARLFVLYDGDTAAVVLSKHIQTHALISHFFTLYTRHNTGCEPPCVAAPVRPSSPKE